MNLDILTIGEILIDLTQTGADARGIAQFAANPGGAPANVAVAASRLGAKVGFAGCVGRDAFGEGLIRTLEENRVDTSCVACSDEIPTTLAVVSVAPGGERSFSFYRNPGADLCLTREQISDEALDAAKIVHFGSVSLTADPSCSATLSAASDARTRGRLVTYDPNFRAALWSDRDLAVRRMRAPLPLVDILKISDEETELLSGKSDPAEAAEALAEQGIRLVLVTLGAEGVYYRFGPMTGTVPGFRVKVADTNGAGDTFFGAVLSRLVRREGLLEGLTQQELESILLFANRAASLTTSRPGAIPAMPYLAEVEAQM